MSNVIKLFGDDFKCCSYYQVDGDEDFGVRMRDKSLIITPLNKNEWEVYLNGEEQIFKREDLAEFLHVITVLIDSEDEFKPSFDLIGLDY